MAPLPLAVEAQEWFDEVSFVNTLMRFAAIDSGTRHVPGINEKVSYYKKGLKALGFAVTLYSSGEYGNDLAAVLEGEGTVSIALIGHIDTVYKVGDAKKYPPRIEGDRLYGLGTSDMHGGNLLMVEALRFLRERGFKGFKRVLVILNNDEETASMHSRPWLQRLLREHKIDVGLEFESQDKRLGAGINITVARRAVHGYRFEVTGEAGHAGLSGGKSATRSLTSKLNRLEEMVESRPGMELNSTELTGGNGIQFTTVANNAGVTLGFRVASLEQYQEIPALLDQIVANAGRREEGTEATYEAFAITPPPYQPTPQIERLAELGREEAEELNLPFATEWKGGTSDANAIAELGIPVLASMGPLGDRDHNAAEEHMLLGDPLRDKFAFVVGLLARICQEWAA